MRNILIITMLAGSVLLLSGCNGVAKKESGGNVLKSIDKGDTWEPRVSVDEKRNISRVNVLSMVQDPANSQVWYLGSEENGIFVTRNGADNWERIELDINRVYGVAVDRRDSRVIYASGNFQGRGKVFKSLDGGAEWREIYTEPADGTVVSSLEINSENPDVLYLGTSEGAILKTADGGQTWRKLFEANGPVTDIGFDANDDQTVYFLVFNRNFLRTRNGGDSVETLRIAVQRNNRNVASVGRVMSMAADPLANGVVYVGSDTGIFRSEDSGGTWSELNIVSVPQKFPIRALAINPRDSDDIFYSTAQAIYKSADRGETWSTFQLRSGGRIVQVLDFDRDNPQNVFAGLRNVK